MDVADAFFETFDQSLEGSSFVPDGDVQNRTIGSTEVRQKEYTYTRTDVVLRVVVAGFVRNGAVYLVIGYFNDADRDTYIKDLEATITNLSFS